MSWSLSSGEFHQYPSVEMASNSCYCSYDSQEDGKTSLLTAHTAFQDPSTPPDALLRESIELRLLVFYD